MRRLLPILVLISAIAAGSYVGFHRATPRPVRIDNALIVSFLDESLGNAIVLETPEKHFAVVDPGPEATAEGLVEYLQKIGVRSIDVVLTTSTAEHSGALQALDQALEVKRVVRSTSRESGPEQAIGKAITESLLTTGECINLSPTVRIEALGPPKAALEDSKPGPLVTRVRHGDTSFLLMSDASIEDEAYLIRSGGNLISTVLAVPNHGRAGSTSLELLARVRPRYIVVLAETGVGRPDPGVMKRISPENTGAYLHRTDKDGIIDLVGDGRSIIAPSVGGAR